jgi:hypothetical protein
MVPVRGPKGLRIHLLTLYKNPQAKQARAFTFRARVVRSGRETQAEEDNSMSKLRGMLLFGCLLATPAALGAQTIKDMRVSEPTRLDWQFAAFGFKASKLPADYDSAKQRYQVHVPAGYKANRTWPMVVFISAGDGPAGWNEWKKICAKHRVFFCSPYQAGNSCPAAQRARIILDMLDDVRRRYRIDPDQTYLSGISGGGRMACTIGFNLPEWFGGVAPVCGTNPIPKPAYLRHRAEERLAVAFITGADDFNRKENEVYMYPWFQELGIHSRLWVVPKMGHTMAPSSVLDESYLWMAKDLPRRREDAKKRPGLAMSADKTPTAIEQADSYLEAAEAALKRTDRIWRGVTLLQGVTIRWSKTEAGQKARARLKTLGSAPKLIEAVAEQGSSDEQKSLTAQAKALERFGLIDGAIEAWEILAQNYQDNDVGRNAAEQARRLRRTQK